LINLAPISAVAEQADGFGQRQADDVGVGAVDTAHEDLGAALDGVTARLALAFAALDVSFDLGGGQAAEGDGRHDDPCTDFMTRRGDGDGGNNLMPAAGEECKAGAHGFGVFRLRQDAPPAGHRRVGAEHEHGRARELCRDGADLLARQPERVEPRQLAFQRGFVDGRGADRIGRNAGLRQQRLAPRTFARQQKAGRADESFEAIGDTAFREVIRRHLHHDLVARQHADAVLAHLAGRMGDDLVPVLQLHAKVALGRSSLTTPSNSRSSSFGIRPLG